MASSTQFTHGPDNVDSLLATTKSVLQKSKELLNDAVFNRITVLSWLQQKARINRQGGASILVPLLYAKNNTFKAYSGDDPLDTSGQEGMTNAQAQWRNYGGTIKYDGDEVRMNAGQGKIIDLVKAKTHQAMLSARDTLSTDLWATSQVTKKIAALPVLVDATSTVQDINSTTSSWWQSQVVSGGSFAGRGLADMRNLFHLIVRAGQNGAPAPDYGITTQLILELYEAAAVPAQRYESKDRADLSFKSLLFKGMPLEFDPSCPSGQLFMLSSDALEYVVHSDCDWAVGDFIEPASQDVKIAKVLWMGNLVTNNRRRLGKITGITA